MTRPARWFIAIPADSLCAPIQTMLELTRLIQKIRVPVQFLLSTASNIPRARNSILNDLRQADPDALWQWVLWVDNDIVIPWDGHHAIAAAIERAWNDHVGWTAHYPMANGESVLMRARKPMENIHYSREELPSLPDWTPIGMTGFGMLFLQQPTRYVFHADVTGEDVHFWLEQPTLDIRYAKDIRIGHMKSITLDDRHDLRIVPAHHDWLADPNASDSLVKSDLVQSEVNR